MIRLKKSPYPTIGISGTNGYLGGYLYQFFSSLGYTVISFSRQQQNRSNHYYFNLESPSFNTEMPTMDYFIHCSWNLHINDWNDIETININGSISLFKHLLNTSETSIFFISSLSAFYDASSQYGRSKFIVEEFCLNHGITVIKPGLIYDKNPKGIVGSLSKLANISPLLPRVWPSDLSFYLCYLPDIGTNILNLIQSSSALSSTSPYIFAHSKPILFRNILQAFSKWKCLFFFYIPWQCLWGLMKLFELLNIPSRLKSDNLISLLNQNTSISFSTHSSPNLKFTEFMIPQDND